MRVLLVTWTDQLLQKLQILSPEFEYCAIVTDEVESARKLLKPFGFPKNLIYPLYDLKKCVKDFYYDYVVCVEDGWADNFLKIVQSYDVPKNKIIALNIPSHNDFLIERSLRYFKNHAAEFDMFATGMSYAEYGLDVTKFKRKLFNFARSSQDLYYNFQVAKFAVSCGGGCRNIRYALVGLTPYSFHYDLSKSTNLQFLMVSYLIAFNDLHNFHLPADVYRKFLRKEYLSSRLPLEPFDVNNPFYMKIPLSFMNQQSKLKILRIRDGGGGKDFPETRTENIKILDDYLTLCEQNNICPIMVLIPLSTGYMKIYSKSRLDEMRWLVGQACRKHPSALFIDGWKLYGIDDSDFFDHGHMNIQGAAKFSAFLNEFVERLDAQGL